MRVFVIMLVYKFIVIDSFSDSNYVQRNRLITLPEKLSRFEIIH